MFSTCKVSVSGYTRRRKFLGRQDALDDFAMRVEIRVFRNNSGGWQVFGCIVRRFSVVRDAERARRRAE